MPARPFRSDRQWLSARDNDLAAPARVAGRDHRLSRGAISGDAVFTLPLYLRAAHTRVLLTIARVVQGFGAAGIMSVNMALVRFTYPHQILGRGIGFNALGGRVSCGRADAGRRYPGGGAWPTVCDQHSVRHRGGGDWNGGSTPYPAQPPCFRLAKRADERDHVRSWHCRHRQRRTWRGATFYLSEAMIAAIAGMLLVRRQLSMASPLLPIDLLRIPIFTLSICTSIASFCAQMLALVAEQVTYTAGKN